MERTRIKLADAIILCCYKKEDQKRYGEALMRKALSEGGLLLPDEPYEISTEARGKPYFPGHPELHFSISDSEDRIVYAFCGARIGVDLQAMRRRRRRKETDAELASRCKRIAKRAFAQAEQQYLSDRDEQETIRRFFHIWSAKEAYVKYTGQGIDGQFAKTAIIADAKEWPPALPDGSYLWRRKLPIWSAEAACSAGELPEKELVFRCFEEPSGYALCICTEQDQEIRMIGRDLDDER